MPLVICPGCQTTLDVPEGGPDQSIACSVCATVFRLPPASPPPLAIPIGPAIARLRPAALAAVAAVPDEFDPTPFTVTDPARDPLRQLRLETILKETADGLLLASGLNIVAAFGTAIAVGILGSTSATAAILGYVCLALWLGGLGVVLVGAAHLKQRRRPDLVRAAGVSAILVGVVAIGLSGASLVAIELFQTVISLLTILIVLGAELLSLATAAFTIYAGVRTLRTLRRPEVVAALSIAAKTPRQRQTPLGPSPPPPR
jgi:LSD1 subclass zinc finger protein